LKKRTVTLADEGSGEDEHVNAVTSKKQKKTARRPRADILIFPPV